MLTAFLDMGAQSQEGADHSSMTPAGDADNGKKLYNKIGCWQCHGYSAQGGSAGPALVPGPLPFPAFDAYTRVPAGEMPPYTTKVLSDAHLADIYAFLKSIPPPRNVKDIPLLNRKEP
jgi:ubiquinol-cytochrome c reductase cytochrome c subunit